MSVRGAFYISWHEEVKWLNLHLSSQMGMWYILPAGALFWQLSIHLHMDGITNRVLSLFQCFRKVQVLNVSFDIGLHVGGGQMYMYIQTEIWYLQMVTWLPNKELHYKWEDLRREHDPYSFFCLTYTCYETVKTYHFFFKLVNKSSFIDRHKKLVRMKL